MSTTKLNLTQLPLTTSDFDYSLDPQRIAQCPLADRDKSRLMLLSRKSGAVAHHVFSDLPSLLRKGDLLVLNDTRVIPARFYSRRKTGGKIEGLFLRECEPRQWECLLKDAQRCKVGEVLEMDGVAATLTLQENLGRGMWRMAVSDDRPVVTILGECGITPLPPYIDRRQPQPADVQAYQTIYANTPGAVAAPTAGLHFTPKLMQGLAAAGIDTAAVTLHVGLGTFSPVKAESIAEHKMHAEWYDLPAATAEKLNVARREGRRIVAVGTTSVRTLETVARAGEFRAASGWTDIFIYPPAQFRAVDALVTNFHLPRSTLLMLVAALCSPGTTDGLSIILSAYRQAQEAGYRFYSYGDAMLIQ